MNWFSRIVLVLFVVLAAGSVMAQDANTAALPPSYNLQGLTHIYQGWNNCGPATVTMGLTYYGATADQYPAAEFLKPNGEDKNVSPWQMVEYVNSQVPGTTKALVRYGGSLDTLKLLISNDFPVIIEEGYDPPEENLGWMGHYLLIKGYDDPTGVFITYDSYKGPDRHYTYEHINEYWRHFNRLYIVLYDMAREEELLALLGSDADPRQNVMNSLEEARQEAIANPEDPFAWFNMGTNFVELDMMNEAAVAFDQARNVGGGLPWRMMWYQFGPFEAYYATGRYNDMLVLANQNLNDGGGMYVEETFYYAGLARQALGETDRAQENFNQAIFFNPNFTPAQEALASMQAA